MEAWFYVLYQFKPIHFAMFLCCYGIAWFGASALALWLGNAWKNDTLFGWHVFFTVIIFSSMLAMKCWLYSPLFILGWIVPMVLIVSVIRFCYTYYQCRQE